MTKLNDLEYTVYFSKGELINLLKTSGHFKVDNENSWAKTYYMQASDKMFINVLDDAIVLSENGGASVMAVICTIKITQLTEKESKLKVFFKIGYYDLDVFKKILLMLLILAIVFFKINILISLLSLFLGVIVLVLWFSKTTTIKSTIQKIENILSNKRVKAKLS